MDTIFHYQFFILAGALVAGFIAIGLFAFDTRKKMRIVFGESDGSAVGFEREVAGRITRMETKLEELEPRLAVIEAIASTSIHKVGFLRFNPFSDTGGDNSFVLVLLDSENNGVALSSLYTREGVRVYGKKISRGEPRQPLSKEEKKVLEETIHK